MCRRSKLHLNIKQGGLYRIIYCLSTPYIIKHYRSIGVDRNDVPAPIDCVGLQSNSAHAHRGMPSQHMSPIVNKIQIPNQGSSIEFSFCFGNLLTKSRETSFHALRTNQANLFPQFVAIANLLCSIKTHLKLGLQSPLVLGQNFCNS